MPTRHLLTPMTFSHPTPDWPSHPGWPVYFFSILSNGRLEGPWLKLGSWFCLKSENLRNIASTQNLSGIPHLEIRHSKLWFPPQVQCHTPKDVYDLINVGRRSLHVIDPLNFTGSMSHTQRRLRPHQRGSKISGTSWKEAPLPILSLSCCVSTTNRIRWPNSSPAPWLWVPDLWFGEERGGIALLTVNCSPY